MNIHACLFNITAANCLPLSLEVFMCFPRHSFSDHPYFSSSVHIQGQTKQNETKQTKPFTSCFLKELSPPNPSVSFCYGIIVKLQDCTLEVSAIHVESLAYIITEIFTGVTKVLHGISNLSLSLL